MANPLSHDDRRPPTTSPYNKCEWDATGPVGAVSYRVGSCTYPVSTPLGLSRLPERHIIWPRLESRGPWDVRSRGKWAKLGVLVDPPSTRVMWVKCLFFRSGSLPFTDGVSSLDLGPERLRLRTHPVPCLPSLGLCSSSGGLLLPRVRPGDEKTGRRIRSLSLGTPSFPLPTP